MLVHAAAPTDRDMRELPGAGAVNQRRRAAMAGLTTRPHAPGLLAFEDGEPVVGLLWPHAMNWLA